MFVCRVAVKVIVAVGVGEGVRVGVAVNVGEGVDVGVSVSKVGVKAIVEVAVGVGGMGEGVAVKVMVGTVVSICCPGLSISTWGWQAERANRNSAQVTNKMFLLIIVLLPIRPFYSYFSSIKTPKTPQKFLIRARSAAKQADVSLQRATLRYKIGRFQK